MMVVDDSPQTVSQALKSYGPKTEIEVLDLQVGRFSNPHGIALQELASKNKKPQGRKRKEEGDSQPKGASKIFWLHYFLFSQIHSAAVLRLRTAMAALRGRNAVQAVKEKRRGR